MRRTASLLLVVSLLTACGSASRARTAAKAKNGVLTFVRAGALWTLGADGNKLRELGGAPKGTGNASSPAWSPDGKKLAFLAGSGDTTDVFVVDRGGGSRKRLSSGSPAGSGGLTWSPDGGRLAFASPHWQLLSIDSNGGKPSTLSADPGQEPSDVAWSPDGRSIAYDIFLTEIGGIYAVDAKSGKPKRLTRTFGDHGPSWSPDGRKLAFCSDGALRVIDADGSHPRTVLRDAGCGSVAWSPDGREIAFTSWVGAPDDYNAELRVVHASGGAVRRLTKPLGVVEDLAWQPLR